MMEWVAGPTLRERLRMRSLSASDAVVLARRLAQALEAAHQRGVVHRDIKPANVILGRDGRATIVDFGLAKDLFLTGLTQPGQLLGTAPYMGPELWDEEEADARTDLFALGATLYHLVAGEAPFVGDDMDDIADAVLAGEFTPLAERLPGFPRELELAVARLLATERDLRYPSAAECARDLEGILAGRPATVPCLVSEDGARHPLLLAEFVTLGSDPACQIVLTAPGVAARHAQVRREEAVYTLRDFGAPAGTFVGAERLAKGKPRALRTDDVIRIGGAALRFVNPTASGGRPSFLRTATRIPAAGAARVAAAALGAPAATVGRLEQLTPDPWAEACARREVEAVLGGAAAEAVAAARWKTALGEAERSPAALRALTGQGLGDDPAEWLAWWHRVRSTAPPQLAGPGAPPGWRVRVVAGAASPTELPLDEESVVLIGRDPRCHLRLGDPRAPRLQATVLRLDRRLTVIGGGGPAQPVLLGERSIAAAFWDPGVPLRASGVQLTLEVAPPGAPERGRAVIPVAAGSFEALLGLGHPSVAAALVATLQRAPGSGAPGDVAARLLPDDPERAGRLGLALIAQAQAQVRTARAVLPRLLGQDVGDDPEAWRALLEARRAGLGPQVAPRDWDP